MKTIKLENMDREEQISFFIQQMSRNGYEEEVALILSTYTVYKNYGQYDVEEAKDNLNKGIMNINCGYEEEEKAWNNIIDVLGVAKVMDIIDHITDYMDRYSDIMLPLEQLKENVLRMFCEI